MATDQFEGRITLLTKGTMREIMDFIDDIAESHSAYVENIYVSPKYEEPDA